MRLAVGYPVIDDSDDPFVGVVEEYREQIAEVYFAWPGDPSGRSPFGRFDAEAEGKLERDLHAFRSFGLGLDLLLNASCYGPEAASPRLVEHSAGIIDWLASGIDLDVVTT